MKFLTSILPAPASRLGSLFAACLIPTLGHAADMVWSNSATITFPPQIDATNFINSGVISITTRDPFETSDTLNFTNSGTMIGSVGWFFDDAAPEHGPRRPSDNFVNLNQGLVEADDGAGGISFIIGGPNLGGSLVSPSYLWINASNVVNKGTLRVGADGYLKIKGTNVDLSRSALDVALITGFGSLNGLTNFAADVGIIGEWWGTTNGINFNSAGIYNGNVAATPVHSVQVGPGGPSILERFSVAQPLAFGYSNSFGGTILTLTNADGSTTNVFFSTNILKQAVFVGLTDPSLSAAVTFTRSTSPTNGFQTVAVHLSMTSTNVITQLPETTDLFFYDTLASETNRGLLSDITSTGIPPFVYERPANYNLTRVDDGTFALGQPGNITPDGFFLYDPQTFTNSQVTGDYAGYAAFVDYQAQQPPLVAAGFATNLVGRIQVDADNLDLRNTRVRGQGEVAIRAKHVISNAGAAIDSPNVSFVLGSTNGDLRMSGLTKPSVTRLKGDLLAWSAVWSTVQTVVFTNNFAVTNVLDTNGVVIGTNSVPVPLTNSVALGLYALILDGDNLVAQIPVFTWDLDLNSTNMLVNDSLNLVQGLNLQGQSFTLNGTLNLTTYTAQNTIVGQPLTVAALTDWVYTNAPSVLFFTNNGTLNVPNQAHFGDDRPIPYSDFVNTGSISVGSFDLASTYVENDGTIIANVGPLDIVGQAGKFQGGATESSGNLSLSFNALKFFKHNILSIGTLNLAVTDNLSDAGPGSANIFTTDDGFNLPVKPASGDLLGTTIRDRGLPFVEVDHVWAGEDRGASSSGFSDNVALGQLILVAQDTAGLRAPLFSFTGTNGQRGLYVDLLDLSSLGANYTNMIQIDPSLTIYYASAKLGFTPPDNSSGIPQEPEEFLNGQFGGHLVWVSGFAGPNSSTAVIINGQTVFVNSALRNSKIIDSDGDGIPNFYDSTPFGGSGGTGNPSGLVLGPGLLSRPASGQQVFSLNFNAAGNSAYRVEMTTDLAHPSWQLVDTYTNVSPATANVTITDTNNVAGRQRFYRVRLVP